MIQSLKSVVSLLTGMLVMTLGHGLLGTLLGIRAIHEGYPDWVIGVMAAGYYAGFIIGTHIAASRVKQIGHIRLFATCAALASSLALCMVLVVTPFAWVVFRFVYGMCVAGIYMVIESWLNGVARNAERGKVLSVYMLVNYTGVICGQGFLFFADTAGFSLFALCAILLTLSLVPLTISDSVQPSVAEQEKFGLRRLFATSPLATLGCLSSGLILGAFWGFGPVMLVRLGMGGHDTALFIAATLLGGLLLQWPIGSLSDKMDRRVGIGISATLSFLAAGAMFIFLRGNMTQVTPAFLVCAVIFGGGNYTLYSLFLSLINDVIAPKHLMRAGAGLLSLHAMGAVAGPVLAGALIHFTGNPKGLLTHSMIWSCFIIVMTVQQIIRVRNIPQSASPDFVPVPRAGMGVLLMDPRLEQEKENPQK